MTTSLAEALETLSLLPDWESRYGYVLELAKALPPFPEADKTEANFVRGCTAQVWETHAWDNEKLTLNLCSDALIVQGLLALVWLAYNGKSQAEIAATNLPDLLAPTGLLQHLSPNRRSGFAAVVQRVQILGTKA
jgi:cysteine desulfuration protein SufE